MAKMSVCAENTNQKMLARNLSVLLHVENVVDEHKHFLSDHAPIVDGVHDIIHDGAQRHCRCGG